MSIDSIINNAAMCVRGVSAFEIWAERDFVCGFRGDFNPYLMNRTNFF